MQWGRGSDGVAAVLNFMEHHTHHLLTHECSGKIILSDGVLFVPLFILVYGLLLSHNYFDALHFLSEFLVLNLEVVNLVDFVFDLAI